MRSVPEPVPATSYWFERSVILPPRPPRSAPSANSAAPDDTSIRLPAPSVTSPELLTVTEPPFT
ncbi:hypothetical protein D3C85_1533250 [compost metagenome]